MCADKRNDECRRGESEREAERDRAARSLTYKIVDARPEDRGRNEQLCSSNPEDDPAHSPQAAKRQFESDREEQQDDAQLREGLDRVGIADRDEVEPFMLRAREPRPAGPTRKPIRMNPMIGLMRMRAKAG
jgi:hypothetical protein